MTQACECVMRASTLWRPSARPRAQNGQIIFKNVFSYRTVVVVVVVVRIPRHTEIH